MLKKYVLPFSIFSLLLLSHCPAAFSADLQCEVLTVKGSVWVAQGENAKKTLKEGDILTAGSTVWVDKESYLDIAYDKDWGNVTRIGADSKVRIDSLGPVKLVMAAGDIFARLEKLPKRSSFQVQAPAALAAVRGTVYRVSQRGESTLVFNFSENSKSVVQVFGLDYQGNLQEHPVLLDEGFKTEAAKLGRIPANPDKMSEEDFRQGHKLIGLIDERVKELKSQKRSSRIQRSFSGHPSDLKLRETWTVSHVRMKNASDASYYDPVLVKTDYLGEGTVLHEACIVCLEREAQIQIHASGHAEDELPVILGGPVADSLEKILDGKAESGYLLTSVWVAEGAVAAANYMTVNGRSVRVSEETLKAKSQQDKDQETANRMITNACAFSLVSAQAVTAAELAKPPGAPFNFAAGRITGSPPHRTVMDGQEAEDDNTL